MCQFWRTQCEFARFASAADLRISELGLRNSKILKLAGSVPVPGGWGIAGLRVEGFGGWRLRGPVPDSAGLRQTSPDLKDQTKPS
jgi:hypothetical protein